MKRLNFKIVFSVVFLILIVVIVTMTLMQKSRTSQESVSPKSNAAANTTPAPAQQVSQAIEGVKVPDGWYAHQTYGMENEITVLSRTKELPNNPAVEQISVSNMNTSLSPEDFISRQNMGAGTPDASNVDWSWGIYKGHKTFSVVSSGDAPQWFVYVFGGHTVYEFTLSPNDQTNPNLEQDRADFWKVITYYMQDPSFELLSRDETLNNCKVVTLPNYQEPTIQVEPETGYVVINFTEDGKKTYVFFNVNDDLPNCTPSVKTLLSNIKDQMPKAQ